MLDELTVSNLGLIAHATIEPGSGLVALTGETGAGKTLLLGALRLLRGDTARTDRIGPDGVEARVEGRFLVGGEELVAARRVTEGRSRAYLDGSMSPAGALAERLGPVVEIVGQHEHLALGRDSAARAVVDAALDGEGRSAAEEYHSAWEALQRLEADRDALGGDRHALERNLDLARHQVREIRAAGFEPGEDAELRATLQRLRNAEEIAADLATAHAEMGEDGAAGALGTAVDALRSASTNDPRLVPLADRLAAAAAEIADVGADVRRAADGLEHDPAALDSAEHRMAALGDLRRKYGDSLDAVLAFAGAAEAEADRIEGLLERADSLAAEIRRASERVGVAGEALTTARRRAAKSFSEAAAGHLAELGFRDPVVRLTVEPGDPGPHGRDRVRLLFASDSALEPGPVGRIASGGELSRLVLAVNLAAGVADAPVVAFDEIDAGIGGSAALAMGRKLADLARGRQVLVVTHLPQVAAFADSHFVVERSGTSAGVRRVEGSERLAELTRMLGGLPESERGRDHAAELVDIASAHRSA
jgi:DNA repair protein RecN (Recombination protein N)